MTDRLIKLLHTKKSFGVGLLVALLHPTKNRKKIDNEKSSFANFMRSPSLINQK